MNYFDKYSSEQAELITLPYSRERSTRYSDRLRDFSVTIPRRYKDVYVNSFFPGTATPWNFLPLECFPLIYDLNGFQSRINCRFFLNRFPVCFKLFMLLFLVTPYLVVAAQRCMEWISIKKKKRATHVSLELHKWKNTQEVSHAFCNIGELSSHAPTFKVFL